MKYFLSLTLIGMATAAPPAHAEELVGVWFAGGTVDASQSAYGGAVVALPGSQLGKGLAIRVSANSGNYDYHRGPQRINGDYTGGEIALAHQISGSWGWANFSAGPRLTDTRLKPGDPDNRRRGTRLDVGLQADGALDSARWRLTWLGSFAPADEVFLARLELGRKFGGGPYRVGVEGGVVGDPSFTQWSMGPFFALPLGGRTELKLGTGSTFQHSKPVRAYASIGLSSTF